MDPLWIDTNMGFDDLAAVLAVADTPRLVRRRPVPGGRQRAADCGYRQRPACSRLLRLALSQVATRIGELMWMGGSAGPGNHTAAAEFNAFVDPESINEVLSADLPLASGGAGHLPRGARG